MFSKHTLEEFLNNKVLLSKTKVTVIIQALCLYFQTLSMDPDIEEENDDMKDDSVKWAVAFVLIGVSSGIGIFLQVSEFRDS